MHNLDDFQVLDPTGSNCCGEALAIYLELKNRPLARAIAAGSVPPAMKTV